MLTEQEAGEIRMWYRQAKDKELQVKILADMFLVPEAEICKVVGIPTAKERMRRKRQKALQMVRAGKSREETARTVGVTAPTVRRWLKEDGKADSTMADNLKRRMDNDEH